MNNKFYSESQKSDYFKEKRILIFKILEIYKYALDQSSEELLVIEDELWQEGLYTLRNLYRDMKQIV